MGGSFWIPIAEQWSTQKGLSDKKLARGVAERSESRGGPQWVR